MQASPEAQVALRYIETMKLKAFYFTNEVLLWFSITVDEAVSIASGSP